jgi:NAD+ kinase
MPRKFVAIFAKLHDPRCQGIANELVSWLEARGCTPLVDTHLAKHIGYSKGSAIEEILEKAELVVVLGGDGTLLSAARVFYGIDIPILGINLGSLGFLTEVTVEELYHVLERALENSQITSKRMMLEATIIRSGRQLEQFMALNEIVINKGAIARVVDLEASVNRHPLTTVKADGLIISTPTGSTGYSMSAGGPIIHPSMSCLVITPICPHTLTNRPIVVTDDSVVSITVKSSFDEKVYLTMDGQTGFELQEGDSVEVRKAAATTSLVVSRNRDYFELLRTKLKWGER